METNVEDVPVNLRIGLPSAMIHNCVISPFKLLFFAGGGDGTKHNFHCWGELETGSNCSVGRAHSAHQMLEGLWARAQTIVICGGSSVVIFYPRHPGIPTRQGTHKAGERQVLCEWLPSEVWQSGHATRGPTMGNIHAGTCGTIIIVLWP